MPELVQVADQGDNVIRTSQVVDVAIPLLTSNQTHRLLKKTHTLTLMCAEMYIRR